MKPIDFNAINQAALPHLPQLCAKRLPDAGVESNGSAATAVPRLEHVVPVPDGAPALPPLRGSARWLYRDEQGRLLAAVDRAEPLQPNQRKQFVTRTLWRDGADKLVWQTKHPPVLWSLYGRDRLADRPSAPVLLVEGEKAADAATSLFPEYVCVTSPGGPKAAAKTDYSPLAGRAVTIWPDNDRPGRAYGAKVAGFAAGAGATSVAIVDVPRGWSVGWDVADPRPEGVTVDSLRSMLADATDSSSDKGCHGSTGFDGEPREPLQEIEDAADSPEGFQSDFEGSAISAPTASDWLPKGFRRRADGAIFHETAEGWQWLCSALVVSAATRNVDGESWGLLIRIRDRDGVGHEWAMPMAELAGGGDGYRARFLAMGLQLAPGMVARNALHRLLTAANPRARARCVSTLGWHGGTYVLPDEVIGRSSGESYVLQTNAPLAHAFGVNGSLEGWQETIGRPAIGNSRLVLPISMAFAAPLLRPLGSEGGGMHWRGSSSTGKTAAGEVAGSVCGGGRDGYKVTWRATDNGIESVAAVHNDGLLVLDEIGQVSADALGAVVYMLANGQPKRRMTRDGTAHPAPAFSLLFNSTGEIGLADKLRKSNGGGGRAMAGQQVRVLDLPADADAGLGVFDHLAGFASGQTFADHLKAAAMANYGYPLRAYLQRLVADPPFDGIKQFVEAFVAEVTPAGADGQVRRAAARFAIIAAGGETARRFGIVPWPEGEAIGAAKRLFGEWLAARGGSEPAEITTGLAAVRHFLEVHGSSRFVPWRQRNRVVQNQAGFSREDADGTTYYITPEAWRRDILAGHDAGMIARAMAARGLLKVNADGKPQTKQRLPDDRERKVYVVLPSIFDDGGAA